MAEWYSIVCMYRSFFTHSPVIGHLGCFHVLAAVNTRHTHVLGCGTYDQIHARPPAFENVHFLGTFLTFSLHVGTGHVAFPEPFCAGRLFWYQNYDARSVLCLSHMWTSSCKQSIHILCPLFYFQCWAFSLTWLFTYGWNKALYYCLCFYILALGWPFPVLGPVEVPPVRTFFNSCGVSFTGLLLILCSLTFCHV